jgi:nicotinate dehydrogenase subunit B
MTEEIMLHVNGQSHLLDVEPETPLLYVLRNDLHLKGPKYGCGLEQCGACKVLVDGAAVSSCQLPVSHVQRVEITTVEGLGTADNLHPLQEAFLEEQAGQCGFCTAGMVIAAQGLLNRTRYPSDEEIREALNDNLCRCGTYDRVRRAIKMRIGRPILEPIYEVRKLPPLTPQHPPADLPNALQHTSNLDSWIRLNEDETITIFSGKVELGQGIKTALAQIVAEEMDVSVQRVRVQTADTGQTPDEGGTTGSMSVEASGGALRFAAAEALQLLLSLAFEQLEAQASVNKLTVVDGTISDPITGRKTTYWELMGGKRFGQPITGLGQPKSPETYTVVGQTEKRLDLPGKVTGDVSYVHDMELPGMLHGRVVRPPSYHSRLLAADVERVSQLPGVVAVVRDGSFLGVVAQREEQAIRAMEALRESTIWHTETMLPSQEHIYDDLLNKLTQPHLVVNGMIVNDPIPPIAIPVEAAQTLNATYLRPFQMHASIGPSAAMALWEESQLTVWSHTQAAFNLQAGIADVIGIDPAQVRVIHAEGAGCYGHNGADDAGLDAALLARAVPGYPVLLKWMRDDEHRWEPYGTAMVMQMQASLNTNGTVIDWNHDIWTYTHSTRPRGGGELLAAWHLEKPFLLPQPQAVRGSHFGGYRNAEPLYNFSRQRIVENFVPDNPLRVSALRSLGAYANVFAIESFVDELAQAAGIDPLQFRLRHLDDERAHMVLQAATEKAGWQERIRPNNSGKGRGLAFARYKNRQCYAAVVVELEVTRDSGEIRFERVIIAADAGQVVNPDGLSNQLEGGFVQAASWTLYEQVRFDENGITSLDWESYPILRFSAAPVIEVVILNHPELPFLGAGEATQNPTPAAIANAIYDAVGIRLRQIPFTAERVKAALGN